MKVINFIISVTDFNDAITLKELSVIDFTADFATKTIRKGGKVIFERRYENNPSEVIMELTSQNDLDEWKEKLSSVIELVSKY